MTVSDAYKGGPPPQIIRIAVSEMWAELLDPIQLLDNDVDFGLAGTDR